MEPVQDIVTHCCGLSTLVVIPIVISWYQGRGDSSQGCVGITTTTLAIARMNSNIIVH